MTLTRTQEKGFFRSMNNKKQQLQKLSQEALQRGDKISVQCNCNFIMGLNYCIYLYTKWSKSK